MTNRIDMLYGQNWVEQLRELRRQEGYVPICDTRYGITASDTLYNMIRLGTTPRVFYGRHNMFNIFDCLNNYILIP